MQLTILDVPYDSGRFGERMGAGPLHLLERGLADELRADGHEVEHRPVRLEGAFLTEVTSGVEAMRRVSLGVAECRRRGRFPLVLSGHCGLMVGTVAGLGPARTGVLWFDAHGDLNTPDTSPSGYFDGMGYAMLLGYGWDALRASIPGLEPLPASQASLLSGRDLDPGELALIRETGMLSLSTQELRAPGGLERVARLATGVEGLHVHLDADAFDPSVLRGNHLPCEGGLEIDDVLRTVEAAAAHAPLRSIGIASYAPEEDQADAGPALFLTCLRGLLALAADR